MYKIKETIYPIFEGNAKGIAIDVANINKELGKIKKINYTNFKYVGQKNITDTNNIDFNKTVEFIEIKNISDRLMNVVIEEINDILDSENITIIDAIDKIINLFAKKIYIKEVRESLYGDLGEAIFIIKCQEYGIDATKYLRKLENSLYDFKFHDKFCEIKACSSDKNEYIITDKQLNEIKNKEIITVKFKCVTGEKTIIDLYDMIKSTNELISTKRSEWLEIANDGEDGIQNLLENYSVILENCRCSVFKNEKFPKIIIEESNALKSAKFHINCTDSELKPFDEFIMWCRDNNIN